MSGKKCAVCKRTSIDYVGGGTKFWLCADCRARVDSYLEAAAVSEQSLDIGKSICDKCRKRKNQCRFSEYERSKITACSDWEAKDAEHSRRRWAKFEE